LKVIVFILLFSLPFLTCAQELDSTKVLEEVTISVNRTATKIDETPQRVKIISAKEISQSQSQTTADLLQNTGSVAIQKSQAGGGSPVIRGFEASRVLLMIDGVRINNLIFRSGHLQNIINYDQNTLDRMEVLFGPSSTQYGSDALGGVVAMYSKLPVFKTEENKSLFGNISSRYSSANNEKTVNFSLGFSGKKWAYLGTFTTSDFGDVKQGKNGNMYKETWLKNSYVDRINGEDTVLNNPNPYKQVGSAYSQFNLMQKFAFVPSKNTLHSFTFQFTGSSDINRYDRLSEFTRSQPTFAQ
jgi:hemoglobin/transferrin/lactoferrin receptor protein